MVSTFDPDDIAPDYIPPKDEPRVKDPVRQKRGRNSRLRGHKVEREWFVYIERQCNGLPVHQLPERRGTSGVEDGRWLDFSFELKSVQWKDEKERWPAKAALAKAWEQARRRAQHRTPVVVVCARRQGKLSQWRIYLAEGADHIEGRQWVSDTVLTLRTGQ